MDSEERLRWVIHKGKKFLYIDYSGLSAADMVIQVEKVIKYVNASNETFLKSIVDVNNTSENMQSRKAIMKAAKLLNKESRHWACIGLSPLKRGILNIIVKFTKINAKAFKNDLDAKEWLVSIP